MRGRTAAALLAVAAAVAAEPPRRGSDFGAHLAWATGPPVRHLIVLTKHDEGCFKAVTGAMLWIATADLPCLGAAPSFCGSDCGVLEINGQKFNVTQINPADGADACGSCAGCPTTYVALDRGIPAGLQVKEGRLAAFAYNPPGTRLAPAALPDCPKLPSPQPPPEPPAPGLQFSAGGLRVGLRAGSWTAQTVGYSADEKWGRNFSFVPPLWSFYPPKPHRDHPGAHHVGDVTLRVQPLGETNASSWAMYSSARGGIIVNASEIPGPLPANVLARHDITPALHAPGQLDTRYPLGLSAVRSWELSGDGGSVLMRFRVTANASGGGVRLGGFGMSLVPDASWGGLELSAIGRTLSFLEPHIGADHGSATWTRIDGSQTLVVTPLNGTRFEAFRPVLEDSPAVQAGTYEWTALSAAWESEWRRNRQMPHLDMEGYDRRVWPDPKSPWPCWQGNQTLDSPPPGQWNPPTSVELLPGDSVEFGLRFTLAEGGPRSRDAALRKLGRAVARAVPGYVVSPDMGNATLHVTPPGGAAVAGVSVDPPGALQMSAGGGAFAVRAPGGHFGRCRVAVRFTDGTELAVHYFVIGRPLDQHVAAYGSFMSNTVWLPVDYPDPFGRGASLVPWDRESGRHVFQDGRAFVVGLSDDAGGGNHLGFATKVAFGGAPSQGDAALIDDYIRFTLYGSKPAYPWLADPHFQLQEKDTDRILMTVFYYRYTADYKTPLQWQDWQGVDYYTELDKCFTGPSWCGFNALTPAANTSTWHPNDYRTFNVPHQVASYYAMYLVARNHPGISTVQDWRWYLERAANTTIAMGVPGTGLMDGTVFREVLVALQREGLGALAAAVDATMRQRVFGSGSGGWNAAEFPYGSEFNWDTTGQEECAVWGAYYNASSAQYGDLNSRVVDAILAYQPSVPNWAWHGSAEGWGDFSNNAKWMVTGGWEREGQHYRAGLNSIPLGERYRRYPDDLYLLEVAMGAMTGVLTNIDADGAPSMGFHTHPFVLQHDPRSGDYGLAFFGAMINHGAYLVGNDPDLGWSCYLCDLNVTDRPARAARGTDGRLQPPATGRLSLAPRDAAHRRAYLEPLGLELRLWSGRLASVTVDFSARTVTCLLVADSLGLREARLEVAATGSLQRSATGFRLAARLERGVYSVPLDAPGGSASAVIRYDH
eukprot:TRINITY_DN69953_c0_g1_i1.p1 TRINITY_DN69953_c0_g1~~TRINITY_DN69953_c0_g1_i1.p1  ORF type:complete len:1162 (+),score=302.99 TRINITY_DN69953_c0_g1_i1:74-3559(+)